MKNGMAVFSYSVVLVAIGTGCGPIPPDGIGDGGTTSLNSCQNQPARALGFPGVGGDCASHLLWQWEGASFDVGSDRGARQVVGLGGYDIEYQSSTTPWFPRLYLPSLAPAIYSSQSRCVDPPDPLVQVALDWDELYTADYAPYGSRATIEVVGNDGQAVWGRFSGTLCWVRDFCHDITGTFSTLIDATPSESTDTPFNACTSGAAPAEGFPPIGSNCASDVALSELNPGIPCLIMPGIIESHGIVSLPNGGYDLVAWDSIVDPTPRLDIQLASLAVGSYDVQSGAASVIRYDEDTQTAWYASPRGGSGTVEVSGSDASMAWGRFNVSACDGTSCLGLQGRFSAVRK